MTARQWPLFQPGEWDQSFLLALGLSVLLHALILAITPPRQPEGNAPGSSALNAVLIRRSWSSLAAETRTTPQKPNGKAEDMMLTAPGQAAPVSPQRKEAKTASHARHPAGSTDKREGTTLQGSDHPPAGNESRPALKPGEVSVIFMIREDGLVGQILWNKLPAMTDAQLFRVEAAIRARKLPGAMSGQVRTETINIQALLDELEVRQHAQDSGSP